MHRTAVNIQSSPLNKQSLRAESRMPILCLVMLTVFFGLMLLMKYRPHLFDYDIALAETFSRLRSPFLDSVMLTMTQLGDSTSLISISAALALILFSLRLWKTSLICILGFLTSTFTVGYIKSFVGRARPINDLYSGSESFSFPSGHMTNSTVVIGTIGLLVAFSLRGLWRIIAIILTIGLILSVGLSRLYLGAHWPSDILGGVFLGVSLVIGIQFLISLFDEGARTKIKPFYMLVLCAAAGLIWGIHVASNTNLPKYNLSASPINLTNL